MTLQSTFDTFSDNQVITTTTFSTNFIDNQNRGNLARNKMLSLMTRVTETFVGLTSLQACMVESDDPTFATFTTLEFGEVIPLAGLFAGEHFGAETFALSRNPKRYIGIQYIVVGTATAGKVSAGLVLDVQTNKKR